MKKVRINWKSKYHRQVIKTMALQGQLLANQKQLALIRTQVESWRKT